jgi:hypothetical protein
MTYEEFKASAKKWRTEPIRRTCEVSVGRQCCGKITVAVYPAHRWGWMALCAEHTQSHPEAFDVQELILKGERWE